MVATALEAAKVPLRMDQPAAALELYTRAMQQHPGDILPLLGAARVHDAMNESAQALQLYKQARPNRGSGSCRAGLARTAPGWMLQTSVAGMYLW
jgi:hypothetical protein